ncbi:MAG: hypothetical protein DMF66_01465 [Acidobacteria bacterium]|nr:MAG: hypothetical protein DMF66_01465 [Acidobacteriota bacterium]
MRGETGIEVRRAPGGLTREELKRHLLALVLAAVLVWYTVVIPSGASAAEFRSLAPDDEGRDGEVRGRDAVASAAKRAYWIAAANEGFAFGPMAEVSAGESVEDLDWPEYINLD